jgi:hypothetical protein
MTHDFFPGSKFNYYGASEEFAPCGSDFRCTLRAAGSEPGGDQVTQR